MREDVEAMAGLATKRRPLCPACDRGVWRWNRKEGFQCLYCGRRWSTAEERQGTLFPEGEAGAE